MKENPSIATENNEGFWNDVSEKLNQKGPCVRNTFNWTIVV